MRDYVEVPTDGGESAYIRKDSLAEITNIDAIIFDCDGVLIDVTQAYGKAVAATTSYLSRLLTGLKIPQELIDEDVIFSFKRTGGFNNDWSLTYALLMFSLSRMGRVNLNVIRKKAIKALILRSLEERLKYLQGLKPQIDVSYDNLRNDLILFSEKLDDTGYEMVDVLLLEKVGEPISDLLGYPGEVGFDLIPTIFELLFQGSTLFEETFEREPLFQTPCGGLVEEGKIIANEEELDHLSELVGDNRFGIASGSLENTAKYVLGDLSSLFRDDAQIWMDDVLRYVRESGRNNLHKPHPFPLVESAKELEPFKQLLYVGDTMADLYMVRNACEGDARYLFAGVYLHSYPSEKTKKDFLGKESTLVVPTVNDIPGVIDHVRDMI
jgi:phosphoglycolate phosphatase-like HAD superfamily hydrolase